MSEAKLGAKLAKARAISTATLDSEIEASKLTQFQLGELVGIDDRAVRRLLDPERKRADRLDLLVAIRGLGKERRSNEAIGEKPRTLLVSVEPLVLVRFDRVAPSGPILSDCRGGRHETATVPFYLPERLAFCRAPQPAPERACTRFASEDSSCVQGWATSPQGEAIDRDLFLRSERSERLEGQGAAFNASLPG